jgi:DNA-nicking Smr family endonuclease
LIASRIESARARGLRCVVLIHGRGRRSETGESVLRESVPGWLSKAPCATHVLAFAPAPKRLGGEGATLVLLRRAD